MADIICRWRNGTPQTVVELVNALPHEKMPIDEFRSIMEKRWEGFFRTAYQLACQLALYCESEDGYYYPRFDHNITESEARSWLLNWLPKYYVPNPFTKKDGFNDIECPTFVLKALYDYVREHGVCSYALAFKNVFHEETRNNDDIIKNYINNYSRVLSFSKYGNLEIVGSYEEVFGDMNRNDKKGFFDSFDEKKCVSTSNLSPNFTPSQIIYYGVPGCGKSNKIREQLKDVPEKNKVRVVFHPEYTNAEFIGQILPVTNGGIRYEFTPGPFTQIIKRAYLDPNEQFYLVIEEINRGNAAAIFGDTFQLLDRLKAGETDSLGNDPANAAVNTFTEGWSQYFVQNDDVNAYIRKATKLDDGSYQERNDGEPIEEIKIKEIHFNANTAIRLPPNLSILATMNTSDQNVFTLDNAFQRRFDMELVRNEFELATKDVDKSKYGGFKTADIQTQHDAKIADTDVKWGDFWEWINKKIVSTLKGLSSTEDKRLGVWFVSNIDGKIEEKIFAEKVLKYLWDDVFKFKRPQVFAEGIDTLEKLINSFEKTSGKERFDVFKDKANLVAFEASPTL